MQMEINTLQFPGNEMQISNNITIKMDEKDATLVLLLLKE
jgi:hypothetical protein